MKDSFAREKLEVMDGVLKGLEKLGGLKNLVVRYCKKCKHDTIQVYRPFSRYSIFWGSFSDDDIDTTSAEGYYTCLSCGTKWECNEKTVCTEVKPKPAKKKLPQNLNEEVIVRE